MQSYIYECVMLGSLYTVTVFRQSDCTLFSGVMVAIITRFVGNGRQEIEAKIDAVYFCIVLLL